MDLIMHQLQPNHEKVASVDRYLDGLGVELQPFLLVDQKLLDIFALIALELNHLAHLSVIDDGAIASW